MEDCLKYFDLLELPPEATIKEIRTKYYYLKNHYSSDSIEILALNEDFSQELREDYLSRLDDAYEKLNLLVEHRKPALMPQNIRIDDEVRHWIKQIGCFDGAALKAVRERLGIDLKDIFAVTRIQPRHLEDIENEVFDFFRAEVYLRSFIIEYARFLSLDPQKVLADYMPRYRSWAASREGRGLGEVADLLTMMD
jgi:curved DNA-binding protein CbpA